MIDKIMRALDVAYVFLSIWLIKANATKEKKDELEQLSKEASDAIDSKRYDDAIAIISRMRNV